MNDLFSKNTLPGWHHYLIKYIITPSIEGHVVVSSILESIMKASLRFSWRTTEMIADFVIKISIATFKAYRYVGTNRI